MTEIRSELVKRVAVGAFVDADQRKALEEIARREDRSLSSVVRLALAAHVRRQEVDETLAAVRAKPFRPIPTTSESETP